MEHLKKNDRIVLEVKGDKKEIVLPLYGEIKLIVQNGKIVSSQRTEKSKYY